MNSTDPGLHEDPFSHLNPESNPPPRPMSVGIMGTPVSSGNRGVLALGASLVNLCTTALPHAQPFLLLLGRRKKPVPFRSGNRILQVPVISARMAILGPPNEHLLWILAASVVYRFLPLRPLRNLIERSTPWIKAVAEADLVGDIRGGDSFSDIYGLRSFVQGCLPTLTVILIRGRVAQFPQTFGPFEHPVAKSIARFILRRSQPIIARDVESQLYVRSILGSSHEVRLSPDVAFSLQSSAPKVIETKPALHPDLPKQIIGINVNGLMYNGGYTRDNMFGLKLDYPEFLRGILATLLNESNAEIWLIPHTFAPADSVESDPEASRRLLASTHSIDHPRVRLVSREYDQHEIKGVIANCSFFVGSRMHACIAALSQGIPTVGVAYSRKFSGVFESVGMHEWVIDGRQTNSDRAIEMTLALYHRRNEIRDQLVAQSTSARIRLDNTFRDLVTSVGSSAERRNHPRSA